MSTTSKGDPSQLLMPYRECATAPQRNIHFISTPIDLAAVKFSTAQDHTMNLLKNTVFNGWPPYRKLCPQELWEFWNFRCDLTLEDGLVLKGSRIVIPASMRNQVLQKRSTWDTRGRTKVFSELVSQCFGQVSPPILDMW